MIETPSSALTESRHTSASTTFKTVVATAPVVSSAAEIDHVVPKQVSAVDPSRESQMKNTTIRPRGRRPWAAGWYKECFGKHEWLVTDGHYMYVDCGGWSKLDLDECFENMNGKIWDKPAYDFE
jgi:hypothetical protein